MTVRTRRKRLALIPLAILLIMALALSFAPLGAEGQEQPRPKHSALDVVASASDPSLRDKMAPFQSVDPASSTCNPACKSDGGFCTFCYPPLGCLHTDCNDFNPCTDDACETKNNKCVHVPVSDGTSCPTGNVCTSDTCSNGTCVSTPLPDGTFCHGVCTFSDVCVNGTCTTTLNICDDGYICTLDTCDQATGLCVHSPAPGEAGPLVLVDQVRLDWGPALGALLYNTYRGTIPAGGLGSRSPVYDHACFESGDAQLNGQQLSVDPEDLPVGTGFYYLVDGEMAFCGEGPLGTATDGTPERPAAFCPTPP